jgi:hypothetical protein
MPSVRNERKRFIMNNNRMDTLLIRQKHNLVADVLFALVVVAGVKFYLFGLTTSRAAAVTPPAVQAAPVIAVEQGTSVEHSALCLYEPGAWRC